MVDMKVYPAKTLHGTINLPGDKSISHRAAMLAAIAVGETRIKNFSTAEDCQTTLKCLEYLGVSIMQNGTDVLVKGVGKTGLTKPERQLDCENSGTTARLLAGILAGQSFDSVLIGDRSLSKRPMKRILTPLTEMGAMIESETGRLPMRIYGGHKHHGIDHELSVASAQVKSCVLLAGLYADGQTTVIEAVQTRDHTERMLGWFGAEVQIEKREGATRISVSGDAALEAHDLSVPSDISSAAFFMVAAACLKGSDVTLPNVGVNPTRRAILDLLCDLGAGAEILGSAEVCNEPSGTIHIRGGLGPQKQTLLIDGEMVAKLIDELPIIAILGTQLDCGIEVRDAGELRGKESDRIAAIVENLRLMGAGVTESDDGFRVERSRLKGTVIDSFGDHRIAMAFAVAGLLADGKTEIIGAECADISFPNFFHVLADVVR